MKLRTLLLGLLAIAGVGMTEAKVVKITIPLVMPQYADQATDEGWVEAWVEWTLPSGVQMAVNEWNPKTGQARTNCKSGCWGSNFVLFNRTAIPGAITRIMMTVTSGELNPKEVELGVLSGSFPVYDYDHKATVIPGAVLWDFNKDEKLDKFRIELKPNAENESKVVIPAVVVFFDDGKKKDYDGRKPGEEQKPQVTDPIKPVLPVDSLGGGDPGIIDPPTPVKPGNGGDPRQGGQPGKVDPTQPGNQSGNQPGNQPGKGKGNGQKPQQPGKPEWPEVVDKDKVAPPGTRDACKKNLLEYLTEAELKPLYDVWGKECGDAARDWMKEIPAIQKNTSAECQAALKALTYDDYMQFCHGFLETILLLAHDFCQIVNDQYNTSDEEFLNMVMPDLIVLGPELARLYMIKDPQMPKKMKTYVDENVKFYQVLVKYKLGKYVFN